MKISFHLTCYVLLPDPSRWLPEFCVFCLWDKVVGELFERGRRLPEKERGFGEAERRQRHRRHRCSPGTPKWIFPKPKHCKISAWLCESMKCRQQFRLPNHYPDNGSGFQDVLNFYNSATSNVLLAMSNDIERGQGGLGANQYSDYLVNTQHFLLNLSSVLNGGWSWLCRRACPMNGIILLLLYRHGCFVGIA